MGVLLDFEARAGKEGQKRLLLGSLRLEKVQVIENKTQLPISDKIFAVLLIDRSTGGC